MCTEETDTQMQLNTVNQTQRQANKQNTVTQHSNAAQPDYAYCSNKSSIAGETSSCAGKRNSTSLECGRAAEDQRPRQPVLV